MSPDQLHGAVIKFEVSSNEAGAHFPIVKQSQKEVKFDVRMPIEESILHLCHPSSRVEVPKLYRLAIRACGDIRRGG